MSDDLATLNAPGFGSVRIAIAAEEPDFRERLRKVFKPQDRIEIVGEAHDSDSAVRLMALLAPQVLLLDYALCLKLQLRSAPEQGGCQSSVRKVVMLTAPEKSKIIESLRHGAHGIVLKGSARRIWWKSVAAVVAGQYWLGSESLAVLIEAIRDSPSYSGEEGPTRHFCLTPREIEIVRKIANGRSNKEVGRDFSIREPTVKHHLTNIFSKVGVTSRLELALFARDHRIFTTPAGSDFALTPEPENDWLKSEKRQTDTYFEEPQSEISLRAKRRVKNG